MGRLLPLIGAGKIDVEEEFQQSCFHISVYRSYLPPAKKRLPTRQIAQAHPAPIVREYPATVRP